MEKVLVKKEGSFVIGYHENSNDISQFVDVNYGDVINIRFFPKIVMSENECKNYIKKYNIELLDESNKIMQSNSEFYNKFEINFGDFTNFNLIKHSLYKNKIAVDDCSMKIKYKLVDS